MQYYRIDRNIFFHVVYEILISLQKTLLVRLASSVTVYRHSTKKSLSCPVSHVSLGTALVLLPSVALELPGEGKHHWKRVSVHRW